MAGIKQEASDQFEGLLRVADGADLILGAGVNMAAAHVAEAVGSAFRWVVPVPRVLPSNEQPPFFVKADSLPVPVNAALWRLFDLMGAATAPIVNAERAKMGLGRARNSGFFDFPDPPVVICDPLLGPLPERLRGRAVQTAAILPAAEGSLPDELERFLAEGAAPVYIGFGSMAVRDTKATTKTVLEAVERAGVRAVVSRGWAQIASGAMPEGVIAVDELPYRVLFPRMAAVVHHGGAGTTATAARAGVPQVLTPLIMDQYYWGGRVRRLGIGPEPCPLKSLTSKKLAAAIEEATTSTPMATNARKIAESLEGTNGAVLTADAILHSAQLEVA